MAGENKERTEAAAAVTEGSSVSMTIPAFQGNVGGNGKEEFEKFVPEEYKGKEWVQNLLRNDNPKEALFKHVESQASLLGKRVEVSIPGDDATPEQIRVFHKQLGVPDDPEAYQLPAFDWVSDPDKALAEQLEKQRDAQEAKEYQKAMKAAAKEAGLTPKQFQKIVQGHEKFTLDFSKKALEEKAKSDKQLDDEFEALSVKTFGAKKDQVLAVGQKMISQMPESVRSMLKTDSNENLIALAYALYDTHTKYVKEDKVTTAGAMTPTIMNRAEHKEAGAKLMADPAYSDPLNPRHDQVVDAVARHYKTGKYKES